MVELEVPSVASADAGVIVCGPGPGMLNVIVWTPAVACASRIACRNDPGPLSPVVVTVKAAA
jgi:ribose 5-phosphate isomerase RpiB